MENKVQDNAQRNYDKEPIVINNNFTSLTFGIIFWLMFNGLIVCLIFFGDAIDWSQNKEWFLILKDEMSKSARFGTVLIGYISVNIIAFYALYKNLKNPRKIILTDKYIKSHKNFNDLDYMELVDIQKIKKSFFPLLGTGLQEKNLIYYLGSIPASIFIILSSVMIILIRLLLQEYKSVPYLIIFDRNSNKVINIYITKANYKILKFYFKDLINIDIDQAKINFKISNTRGEKDAR